MTPSESAVLPLTLSDYVAILNRRKWVVIQATVVVAVLAFVLAIRQDKVFQTSSEVLLTRQNISSIVTGVNNPDVYADPSRFAETQAGLARAPEVARRAAARASVDGVTAGALLARSSVTPKSNADLLRFTVQGSDPDAVTTLANAYAGAFTAYKRDLDTEQLAKARAELNGRLQQLRRIGQTDSSLYRSLLESAQQLRTMELLQTRNVVVPATGAGQVAPTPKRNALLGAALGLLLGLAFAFLWEALDKRVRTEEEIERRLGLPLLSRLPAPRRVRDEPHLSMIDEPHDAHAEAIRKLRTNLEFANVDLQARTIMVTSSVQREGKSTTIANLAVALARAGRSVALVDVDLRQPALAGLFGLSARAGLTDVVLGRRSLRAALQPIKLPPALPMNASEEPSAGAGRLDVLLCGPLPSDPGEFVDTQGLRSVLESLRESHEYVLVDAPPILVVGDAMALSAHVDAIFVVTALGIVDRRTLADLHRELEASPAPKLGFVVTGADVQSGYGYTYSSAAQRADARSRPQQKRVRASSAASAPTEPEAEVAEKARRWAPRVVR